MPKLMHKDSKPIIRHKMIIRAERIMFHLRTMPAIRAHLQLKEKRTHDCDFRKGLHYPYTMAITNPLCLPLPVILIKAHDLGISSVYPLGITPLDTPLDRQADERAVGKILEDSFDAGGVFAGFKEGAVGV